MAANAAAGNRWQQRNRGSFVPRSEVSTLSHLDILHAILSDTITDLCDSTRTQLSSEQQAILAAVPTFKRTWVRPSFLKPHQRPNYKICKWVIDTTPSTRMDFVTETTSERGGVPLTGASTAQNSTRTSTPIPNPTTSSAATIVDLTGDATNPIPASTAAPTTTAPIVTLEASSTFGVEATQRTPAPAPTSSSTTTTTEVIVPLSTPSEDRPLPSVPSAAKPAQGTPPSEPTAQQQIAEAVKDVQGDEVQKIEQAAAAAAVAAAEDVEMKDGAEERNAKDFVEDQVQVAQEATEGIVQGLQEGA
ncbi:BQ2448_3139 [Microbotryum intermedium]|uniref:BQ2448_3139 protein n=1 Tax=Microbotryum intermedium TaxID=269621 RepID=A0A238FHE7_9BASI|nr:BQ2448_3139 [Microbotryum intermedium]